MNSRSSVNESNLVNFSADIETKDSLLSFPFDHIYACHSESTDRSQTLELDKEVEISTHCVVTEDKDLIVSATTSEISRLTDQLSASENKSKRLKNLLIYHLDLIQQQNEIITKREKLFQALKQENDSLKTKLTRMDRRAPLPVNPPTLLHLPTTSVTSTIVKSEPSTSSQIMLNSFTELVLPDNRTNSFIYESDLNKPKSTFGQDSYKITRTADTDVTNYLSGDIGVSSILDTNLNCENYTMIESKRSFVKKEMETETRSEALYTVTSNSGNPVISRIQRNRRRTSTSFGSLSRLPKTTPKVEVPETSKSFEDSFSVNKKSKMINTYGKSRTNTLKRTSQFTGSLSDRLRLIDTTPTGEDPYQIGEAEMREQSPIPKLMLQKTNHGRMKICTETSETMSNSRRIYDTTPMPDLSTKVSNKMKLDRYNLSSTYVHPTEIKKEPETLIVDEPDLNIVKTEPEIDWCVYNPNKPESLCDFSYGETANNLATNILPTLDAVEFQELFLSESPLNLDNIHPVDFNQPLPEKIAPDKTKKRGARTSSLVGPNLMISETATESKRGSDSKRGRKRALSTTGLTKKRDTLPKLPVLPKPKPIKGKAACRGKKEPLPGRVTKKPYHTLVGDPDLSWYLGLDPDVKFEDVDHAEETKVSTVEVPRWREKPYTSCYSLEGTENLDDKVFEKRHQKLEAEERRQLRWHMRRVREQRHVERLRMRQRSSWCSGAATYQPSVFTIWPQPQRDVRFIEITDTLPVTAFGEIMPAIPDVDFMLPWVRTSKALKRAKRSKTLH